MIQRFSFGHPFPTQSVVLSLPAESGPIPLSDSPMAAAGSSPSVSRLPSTVWVKCPAASTSAAGTTSPTTPMNPATARTSFPSMVRTISCWCGTAAPALACSWISRARFITTSVIPATIFSLSTPRPQTTICISSPAGTKMRSAGSSVPSSGRSYHPAQVGIRSGTEPLGLQDRGGRTGSCTPVQGTRPAAGHDLYGHRVYAGLCRFHRKQGTFSRPYKALRRPESAGHPAGAHHRCRRARRPQRLHLH